MTNLEVILGIGAALITGGVGWWAKYVTIGASKAHRMDNEVANLRQALHDHEMREEAKFDELGATLIRQADQLSVMTGSLGDLHGKLDLLVRWFRNDEKNGDK